MSKHTPGPWYIEANTASYRVIGEGARKLVAVGLPTQFLALSVGTRKNQVAIIPLDESNQANARLIAAAPDLLAACDKLVEAEAAFTDAEEIGVEWDLLHEAYDLAVAAIARARGIESGEGGSAVKGEG